MRQFMYYYCTSQYAYMHTCVSIGVGSNFILGATNILYSDLRFHIVYQELWCFRPSKFV